MAEILFARLDELTSGLGAKQPLNGTLTALANTHTVLFQNSLAATNGGLIRQRSISSITAIQGYTAGALVVEANTAAAGDYSTTRELMRITYHDPAAAPGALNPLPVVDDNDFYIYAQNIGINSRNAQTYSGSSLDVGPVITLGRDVPMTANSLLGGIYFAGRDDISPSISTVYSYIAGGVQTATHTLEDGWFTIGNIRGGVSADRWRFGDGFWAINSGADPGIGNSRFIGVFTALVDTGTDVSLKLRTHNGAVQAIFGHQDTTAEYITIKGAVAGGRPLISTADSTNGSVGLDIIAKGSQSIRFYSQTGGALHLEVADSAGPTTRFIQVSGSNGGNPTLGVSGGSLNITAATYFTSTIDLGHATDTTISRVSAGVVAIEGSNILLASQLGTSGAKIPLLSTANTWSLAQTFTTAPVFTDQSGTRVALSLGTASLVNTGTFGTTVPVLDAANTWATTQTFTVAPVFTNQSTTRAALSLGSASLIDTGTSGAKVPLLSTANTWTLAQTFSVAPVFTDQSGTRAALSLGTASLVATGTSGATIPLLNGTNTWAAAQTLSVAPVFTDVTGSRTALGIGVGQITATATNDDAAAGKVGEIISSTVLVGSAVSLSTSTAANVTSISLTAGDWDVYGNVAFNPNAATLQTTIAGWISTTSAAIPTAPNEGAEILLTLTFPAGVVNVIPVGRKRISLSGTTTVYLTAFSAFTTNTQAAYGFIGARRVR